MKVCGTGGGLGEGDDGRGIWLGVIQDKERIPLYRWFSAGSAASHLVGASQRLMGGLRELVQRTPRHSPGVAAGGAGRLLPLLG
jgi:hypothetical protein